MKTTPAILITDTREQRPYLFEATTSKFVQFEHRHEALPEGDYAAHLPGDDEPEATCVIERKSHSDLLGSLTHDRDRFERELVRLQKYGFKSIVIEGDLPKIIEGLPHSKVNPRSVVASLIAYQQRFGVHVVFASNRKCSEACCYRLCERWCRDRAAAKKEVEVSQ